jgi:hypothetical protein
MAYDFLQASVQYFEADNQITSIGVPMTVSVRQRYPNVNATRQVWGVYEISGSQNNQYSASHPTSGVGFSINARTTLAGTSSVALPGTNQWFNALGLFASTTSRTAYVNTTAGTPNTDSRSITTETSIRAGAASAGNTFTGQLAEFAIWNAALTVDEINSLAQGFKPPRIRPQSLLYYVPLVREIQELRSGITLTANNAPTLFAHPRVY